MITRIKSVTIVYPEGTKTYTIGETYNGLELHQIREHSLEIQTGLHIHIEYAGFTKETDRVFQVINAPIDVQYEAAEEAEDLLVSIGFTKAQEEARDINSDFHIHDGILKPEPGPDALKTIGHIQKNERQRCLQAIEKADKDITLGYKERHPGYEFAIFLAIKAINQLR